VGKGEGVKRRIKSRYFSLFEGRNRKKKRGVAVTRTLNPNPLPEGEGAKEQRCPLPN
jgi:hypothetical protein